MNKIKFQPERLKSLANYMLQYEYETDIEAFLSEPRIIDHGEYVEEKIPFFIYPLLETIHVFPKEWKADKNGFSFWIHDKQRTTLSSAVLFFGFTYNMFAHLFIPGQQNTQVFGGKPLTKTSSSKEIAENMLDLVQRFQAELN